MGLALLRRAVTFIQQDAVMFAGSVGSNLDPFGEHGQPALDAALAAVEFARLSGSDEGTRLEVRTPLMSCVYFGVLEDTCCG